MTFYSNVAGPDPVRRSIGTGGVGPLVGLVRDIFARNAERPLLLDTVGNRTWSYAQLWQCANSAMAKFEQLGLQPRLIESDSRNLKVTYPQDLELASLIQGRLNE